MSPERIAGKIKTELLEVCKRADIWSLGVIFFFLFSGRLPFKGEGCKELYESIKTVDFQFQGEEWENVPQSAK